MESIPPTREGGKHPRLVSRQFPHLTERRQEPSLGLGLWWGELKKLDRGV